MYMDCNSKNKRRSSSKTIIIRKKKKKEKPNEEHATKAPQIYMDVKTSGLVFYN